MISRRQKMRAWLLGFIMFLVGAALGLALLFLTPWPWSLVIILGVAGLFLAMGSRSLLWVWRHRRKP